MHVIEGNTYGIEGFLLTPQKYVFSSIYLLFQIIYKLLYRIEGKLKEIQLSVFSLKLLFSNIDFPLNMHSYSFNYI